MTHKQSFDKIMFRMKIGSIISRGTINAIITVDELRRDIKLEQLIIKHDLMHIRIMKYEMPKL